MDSNSDATSTSSSIFLWLSSCRSKHTYISLAVLAISFLFGYFKRLSGNSESYNHSDYPNSKVNQQYYKFRQQ